MLLTVLFVLIAVIGAPAAACGPARISFIGAELITIGECLFSYGGYYPSNMPWRSNVGEPFSRPSGQDAESESEEPGLEEWDSSLVEQGIGSDPRVGLEADDEQLDLFGHDDASCDADVDVVSAGSDLRVDNKRPADMSDLRTGVGIDNRLFFTMLKVPRTAFQSSLGKVGFLQPCRNVQNLFCRCLGFLYLM